MNCTLNQIFIYPVKSCAGIEIKQSEIGEIGLAFDRQWMIVNQDGQMLTQRKLGAMALIATHINSDGNLILRHPKAGEINASHELESQVESKTQDVSIWKDKVPARMGSPLLSEWLQQALDYKEALSLVSYIPGEAREPSQVERFGQKSLSFSDAAPLLVCNKASLDALNKHLLDLDIPAVDIRHFRPNLVLDGLPAFSEHNAMRLSSDGVEIDLIDHCQRCVMITIDPDTGVARPKATPFKQLSGLNAMPNNPKAPSFGVNACYRGSATKIHQGMGLEVALNSESR